MAFGGGGMGGGPGMGGPGMAGSARPSLRNAFVSLKNRNFRLLWFSMIGSFIGMSMQMIARGWLAFELTGSFAMVGVISIAWGLPMLMFSLPGGAIADRMERRDLVLFSQLGTGLLALIMAVLITIGQMNIPILFAMGLIQGVIFAFNMPARQALIAEIVPPGELMNAIALNNAGMNVTRILGPAAAGVMIGLWGVESAYYAQAAMYLFTLVYVVMLPRSGSHLLGAEARGSMISEIGVGLRYVAGQRTLLMLILMALVPTMLGMPYMMLLPGLAVKELGLPADGYGFLITVSGVGALAGSLIVASMTAFPRKALLQTGTGIGFGAGLFALGMATVAFGYTGALISIAVLGLFSNMYMTLNNTMIMTETRPEFYGRIMSIYMLTFSVFPFMSYPLGILADHITATTTFSILGVGIIAFIVLAFFVNPRFVFRRSTDMPAGTAGPMGAMGTGGPPGRNGPGPGREPATQQPANGRSKASPQTVPAVPFAAAAANGPSSTNGGASGGRPATPAPQPAADAVATSAPPILTPVGGSAGASTGTARRDYMGNEPPAPAPDYTRAPDMPASEERQPVESSADADPTARRGPGSMSDYGLGGNGGAEDAPSGRETAGYGLEDEPLPDPPADDVPGDRESPAAEQAPASFANGDVPTDATAPGTRAERLAPGAVIDANHEADPSTEREDEPAIARAAPAERVELPGPPSPRSAGALQRVVIAAVTASVVTGALSSLLRRGKGRR